MSKQIGRMLQFEFFHIFLNQTEMFIEYYFVHDLVALLLPGHLCSIGDGLKSALEERWYE